MILYKEREIQPNVKYLQSTTMLVDTWADFPVSVQSRDKIFTLASHS